MKAKPPYDAIRGPDPNQQISRRDRRRLVLMRADSDAGAIDILFSVYARPTGPNKRWRPIHSATRVYTSWSALNAEQIINGGPVAGRHFAATKAMLELYERIHKEEK